MSPIYGLTDRGLAFPEIGRIRKGAPKTEANKPGADLKYFRVVFDAAEADSARKFVDTYGATPDRINVVFPFNDIEKVAQFWLEAYTAGRMIAKSDGQIYLYKVDAATGEVLVNNGVSVKTGRPVAYDPQIPEQTIIKNGKTYSNYCKAITRIRVVVPELQRMAYLLVLSSSTYDAQNLSENIQAIWDASGHRIAGVPLVLARKPRMVSCPDYDNPSKRVRREKWLLSIEPSPNWVSAKMLEYQRNVLALANGAAPLELTAPEMVTDLPTGEPEPDEDEFDGWTEAPATSATAPETDPRAERQAWACQFTYKGESYGVMSVERLTDLVKHFEGKPMLSVEETDRLAAAKFLLDEKRSQQPQG